MKTLLKTVAATALIGMGTVALAEPVYMIAQIQIDNHDDYFAKYGAAAAPAVVAAGGKALVAAPTVNTLEGEWQGNWTVVIEFPSEEAALEGWYNTAGYQKTRELRWDTTSINNLVIAPQFVPPTQ